MLERGNTGQTPRELNLTSQGPCDVVHREPRQVASSQVSVSSGKEGPTGREDKLGRYIGSRDAQKQGRAGQA
jgi:hypothetical protein